MSNGLIGLISKFATGIFILGFILFLLKKSYIKAPPDMAYIISGIRKKVVVGSSSLVLPIVERVDYLNLELISVDVKNSKTPTNDFIRVDIDGVVKLEIDRSEEGLERASKNFLNNSKEEIASKVIEVLEGNMREITGQMTISEMIQNRKAFGEKVEENAAPDMVKMGLSIVAFNIQSIEDDSEIISDLGAENSEKIKMNAVIARAEAQKEIRIKKAESGNEAHKVETDNQLEIATRESELTIEESKLLAVASKEKSIANNALSIEDAKQALALEEEKRKVEQSKAKGKVEVQIEVYEGEVKQKAEADLYANELIAKGVKIAKEAEAEGIIAIGKAEAEVLEERGLAEAKAIDKKADAMAKYGEAAIVEMLMSALPGIAESVAGPLNNIDKITMYGEGNVAKMTSDITNSTTQIMNGILDSTGIDLGSILSGYLGGKVASGSQSGVDMSEALEEIKDFIPEVIEDEVE